MASTQKDYYQILGVSRNATSAEIKSAYRRLAKLHHPDRNPGDIVAEEKFKEVAGAYEVLYNTDKRAQYDRYGHDLRPSASPFGGGFGFRDFDDLFGDFFGGATYGSRGRTSGASRTRPRPSELDVSELVQRKDWRTLEEIVVTTAEMHSRRKRMDAAKALCDYYLEESISVHRVYRTVSDSYFYRIKKLLVKTSIEEVKGAIEQKLNAKAMEFISDQCADDNFRSVAKEGIVSLGIREFATDKLIKRYQAKREFSKIEEIAEESGYPDSKRIEAGRLVIQERTENGNYRALNQMLRSTRHLEQVKKDSEASIPNAVRKVMEPYKNSPGYEPLCKLLEDPEVPVSMHDEIKRVIIEAVSTFIRLAVEQGFFGVLHEASHDRRLSDELRAQCESTMKTVVLSEIQRPKGRLLAVAEAEYLSNEIRNSAGIKLVESETNSKALVELAENEKLPVNVRFEAGIKAGAIYEENGNIKEIKVLSENRLVPGEIRQIAEEVYVDITTRTKIESAVTEGDYKTVLRISSDQRLSLTLRNLASSRIEEAVHIYVRLNEKYPHMLIDISENQRLPLNLRIAYGLESLDSGQVTNRSIANDDHHPIHVREYAGLSHIQSLIDRKINPFLQFVEVLATPIVLAIVICQKIRYPHSYSYSGAYACEKSEELKALRTEFRKEDVPEKVKEVAREVSRFKTRVKIFFGARPQVMDAEMKRKFDELKRPARLRERTSQRRAVA